VLTTAFANAKSTAVMQAVDLGFYAADGGMEYAIQSLRATPSLSCSSPPAITVPATMDGGPAGGTVTASVTSCSQATPSLYVFTIASSAGGGANEKQFTVNAVVAINLAAPNRDAGVESWSSVQS
jgi:hypothetical protein